MAVGLLDGPGQVPAFGHGFYQPLVIAAASALVEVYGARPVADGHLKESHIGTVSDPLPEAGDGSRVGLEAVDGRVGEHLQEPFGGGAIIAANVQNGRVALAHTRADDPLADRCVVDVRQANELAGEGLHDPEQRPGARESGYCLSQSRHYHLTVLSRMQGAA